MPILSPDAQLILITFFYKRQISLCFLLFACSAAKTARRVSCRRLKRSFWTQFPEIVSRFLPWHWHSLYWEILNWNLCKLLIRQQRLFFVVFLRLKNLLNELMMTEKKGKKRNLNPSHQLNLNTKNILFTKRRLNKIAIDALIRVRMGNGRELLYLNFIEILIRNKNK